MRHFKEPLQKRVTNNVCFSEEREVFKVNYLTGITQREVREVTFAIFRWSS